MNKWVKRLLIFVVVCTGIHFALLFSGNTHIYPTLQNTLLQGRLGPEIYEFKVFANREVQVGEHQPWGEAFTGNQLNQEELQFHADFEERCFFGHSAG